MLLDYIIVVISNSSLTVLKNCHIHIWCMAFGYSKIVPSMTVVVLFPTAL